MFFLHPMWNSESERLGKKSCTPLGFGMHVAADLIGFAGLLSLVGTLGYLAYRGLMGHFAPSLWWLLIVPFSLGLLGHILFLASWQLAYRKNWEYDAKAMEARWIENGQVKTFRYHPPEL
jgi:hypothetical protein